MEKKRFLICQRWQKQNKLNHIQINQPALHTREFVLITAAVEGNIPQTNAQVWSDVIG